MNRLLDIGFQVAGHWHLIDDQLSLELTRYGQMKNVLYAFVSDGEVKYVGKTVRPLMQRLNGYRNPDASQRTNMRNNARIRELLRSGASVEVLALPDSGLLHFGQFHLNLAAGLEDDLIAVLKPEWNGPPNRTLHLESIPRPFVDSFSIHLHKTYYEKGFFNVPVANSASFGADGEQVEIFCGDGCDPITGSINRRSNTATNAPRIMGGAGLRDWFQANTEALEEIAITVYSPHEIKITMASGDLKPPSADPPA